MAPQEFFPRCLLHAFRRRHAMAHQNVRNCRSSDTMSKVRQCTLDPQMLEAFPFDSAPKYLLRDRDRIYGYEFRKQVEVMNIEEILSAPRSPWQRAYVERVIGSIRRECLDHVIILNEESLRRTLLSYFSYYHRSRLHLSLDKDSPNSRSMQTVGNVVAFREVGGLHHRTNVELPKHSLLLDAGDGIQMKDRFRLPSTA
jgi:transposase InsO family protein